MTIKEHIEHIINIAFKRVSNAFDEPHTSHLIFPVYRDERGGKIRVSEQEMRFAFVESFIEYVNAEKLGWHYGVEVPTKDKYSFGEQEPCISETGRSAMFDLAIYSEQLNLICLIEFKSNNPALFAYQKDYVKLLNPKEGELDVLRYFIQIVEHSDDGTEKSIKDKYTMADDNSNIKVVTKTYSLEKGKLICE